MDDMDMDTAMATVGFEDLDQVMLAMSPARSLATSSAPAATAAAAAAAPAAAAAANADLRRGLWTVDEDMLLVNYIAAHGEGRWNSIARSAGLKRTGKSCRLRWLNYLRPDVRRGNITAEEQLLILELHSRWGNRWSKIAQHLPGRTDNEIKNYWRTRVQKHARHLRCDVNSAHFRHIVQHVWMPRLRERALADRDDQQPLPVAAVAPEPVIQAAPATTTASAPPACYIYDSHRGVAAVSEAHHHHHQYYSEEPVGWTAEATALNPDDASSALLPSALTAAAYTYTSAAMLTLTNVQDCGPTTTDDDVFAGWTCFGDLEDGLWSLDDLCLEQLC